MDYLAEFMRQQTVAITRACSRCYAMRQDLDVVCDRCRCQADKAVFAFVDGKVQWDHEHLCQRCAARGREVFGGIELDGSPQVPRQVRGARGRKAAGRYRGPRAAGPGGAPTGDSEGR